MKSIPAPGYRYSLDRNTGGTGICSVPFDTGTRYLGKFGVFSMPVPDTLVSSVFFNTGPRHFGKVGSNSIPVPRVPGYLYHNTGGTGIVGDNIGVIGYSVVQYGHSDAITTQHLWPC